VQWHGRRVSWVMNKHATIEELLEAIFSMQSLLWLYSEDQWEKLVIVPHGGRFEYLYCSLVNCRRGQNGNPVHGGITGPLCTWGI
jgi:hypothetical protein